MRVTRLAAATALTGTAALVGVYLPGTPASAAETVQFPAGAATEFTVPDGVTCMEFVLEGAAGGEGGELENELDSQAEDASAAGEQGPISVSPGGAGGPGGAAA